LDLTDGVLYTREITQSDFALMSLILFAALHVAVAACDTAAAATTAATGADDAGSACCCGC